MRREAGSAVVRIGAVVVGWLGLVGALGCAESHGQESRGGGGQPHDFVRYSPGHAPLAFVKIENVAATTSAMTATLPGRVTFDEDHTQRVASPIDGRVTAIPVRLGDRVRAGQPLIQLSSPQVGQLQAEAQKATSDLGVAEKAGERVHKLQSDGAVAEKDVTQAEGDLRKAKSDYARATAQLKALGVSPTDPAVNAALHAQIAGIVVDRTVLVGQEVRADQAAPLLTISDLDAVWVLADAYEQDLGLVGLGDSVKVQVPAYPGETFVGKVTHIGEVIDPSTRTVKVRCSIPNPQRRLKPEMFAKVEVQGAGGREIIQIPSRAVLTEGDRTVVIVALEDHVFLSRRVSVGPDVDGQVRVLGGLQPGEKVVTTGALFMKREIDTR